MIQLLRKCLYIFQLKVIPQSVKNLVLCGYWNHITTTYNLLPTMCYLQPASWNELPTTCIVLPGNCYVLPGTCYLVPATLYL